MINESEMCLIDDVYSYIIALFFAIAHILHLFFHFPFWVSDCVVLLLYFLRWTKLGSNVHLAIGFKLKSFGRDRLQVWSKF